MRFLLILACLVLCLFAAVGRAAGLPPAPLARQGEGAGATLLVGFQPEARAVEQQRLLERLNATVIGEIPQLRVLSLVVPGVEAGAAAAALERDPSVAYAEPNARAWAALSPNDPGWSQQWGPRQIGAPLAWDVTLGSPDVIMAVVDSGVTLDHPDLANQLWMNIGEVPSNGVDDDGNGQADDVWGWHFYHAWDGQEYVPAQDNRVTDDNGHGTHVAGIAGAQTDNGIGIAGMAGGSRLMAVKVLDQYGLGWYFDIAQGIVYAVDNGARVINLSLGGTTPSETLQAAAEYAEQNGVLVVAAAGNDGSSVLYPAACEHVVAVAATDRNDERWSRSNHGPQVDLAAPGVDILSTWWPVDTWTQGYWTQSGTSMATPHVAGLAALIWSVQPTWSPGQVRDTLAGTAVDVQAPGWDPYTGWGRVDAYRAMQDLIQAQPYLTKEVQASTEAPGSPVTYTLSFGNLGQTMAGVVVSDSLPPGVQVTLARPAATYDTATHELVWGPLTLTTGAQITATVVVSVPTTVPPCTRLTNTARLFHASLEQPLEAEASHYLRPCRVYLPVYPRAK